MARRQKQPTITRQQALDSRPIVAPIIDRTELSNGGQRIIIEIATSPWRQRLLRLPSKLHRKFEFDAIGVEVLAMCDGQKPVKHIVQRFAKDYSQHPHEAERMVTSFLRMLVRKGVVTLYLPKHKS